MGIAWVLKPLHPGVAFLVSPAQSHSMGRTDLDAADNCRECSSKSSDEGQTWCGCSLWSQRVLTGLRYFRRIIKWSAVKCGLYASMMTFCSDLWIRLYPSKPMIGEQHRLGVVSDWSAGYWSSINAWMLVYNWDQSKSFGWIQIRLVSLWILKVMACYFFGRSNTYPSDSWFLAVVLHAQR